MSTRRDYSPELQNDRESLRQFKRQGETGEIETNKEARWSGEITSGTPSTTGISSINREKLPRKPIKSGDYFREMGVLRTPSIYS